MRSVVALTLLAVLSACSGREAPQDQQKAAAASAVATPRKTLESFQSLDSPSMQFLPRLEEVPGWRLENDPLVFPAENLGDRIGTDSTDQDGSDKSPSVSSVRVRRLHQRH